MLTAYQGLRGLTNVTIKGILEKMLDGFDTEQAPEVRFATKALLLLEADIAYQAASTEACIMAIDRLYRFFDGDLQSSRDFSH